MAPAKVNNHFLHLTLLLTSLTTYTAATADLALLARQPAITAAPALPVNHHLLLRSPQAQRQQSLHDTSCAGGAAYTPCATGGGCCQYGQICTSTALASGSTVGQCAAFQACPVGVNACPSSLGGHCCQNVGEVCGGDGVCRMAGGAVGPPNPPLRSAPAASTLPMGVLPPILDTLTSMSAPTVVPGPGGSGGVITSPEMASPGQGSIRTETRPTRSRSVSGGSGTSTMEAASSTGMAAGGGAQATATGAAVAVGVGAGWNVVVALAGSLFAFLA